MSNETRETIYREGLTPPPGMQAPYAGPSGNGSNGKGLDLYQRIAGECSRLELYGDRRIGEYHAALAALSQAGLPKSVASALEKALYGALAFKMAGVKCETPAQSYIVGQLVQLYAGKAGIVGLEGVLQEDESVDFLSPEGEGE